MSDVILGPDCPTCGLRYYMPCDICRQDACTWCSFADGVDVGYKCPPCRHPGEVRVSPAQYHQLMELADVCQLNYQNIEGFDEDRWLRGVRTILGYLPPFHQHHRVVVI